MKICGPGVCRHGALAARHARIAPSPRMRRSARPACFAVLHRGRFHRRRLAIRFRTSQWSPHPAIRRLHTKAACRRSRRPHFPAAGRHKPRSSARRCDWFVAETVNCGVRTGRAGRDPITRRCRRFVETVARRARTRPAGARGRVEVCSTPSSADCRGDRGRVRRPRTQSRGSKTWCSRSPALPMEPPRGAAAFDRATGRFTVHAGNGGAVRLKHDLAAMLDVPPNGSAADGRRRRQLAPAA